MLSIGLLFWLLLWGNLSYMNLITKVLNVLPVKVTRLSYKQGKLNI